MEGTHPLSGANFSLPSALVVGRCIKAMPRLAATVKDPLVLSPVTLQRENPFIPEPGLLFFSLSPSLMLVLPLLFSYGTFLLYCLFNFV